MKESQKEDLLRRNDILVLKTELQKSNSKAVVLTSSSESQVGGTSNPTHNVTSPAPIVVVRDKTQIEFQKKYDLPDTEYYTDYFVCTSEGNLQGYL